MQYLHDRYQAFCRFCVQTFEQDSALAAIKAAEEHERQCPRKPQAKPAPPEAAK
jgi:hypothetical protein